MPAQVTWLALGLAFVFRLCSPEATAAGLKVERLRCEYAENPLGIDVTRPRLSWMLSSDERNQSQTAYQVLVSSSEETLEAGQVDLWDSGRVNSDQSIQVVYAGAPLQSRQRCHWKVRVWDKAGRASADSKVAFWEMGLLQPADWRAEWIGFAPPQPGQENWKLARWVWHPDGDPATSAPVARAYFRRAVHVPPDCKIKRACLRLTADDQFTLYVNGRQAGKSMGKPYEWKVLNELEIAPLLVRGANVLAIAATNRAAPAGVLGQLVVELDSGSPLTVQTDKSWRTSKEGPPGWRLAGFDDAAWSAAMEVGLPGEGPWQGVEFSPMGPCPYLRKTVTLDKPIRQARLYVTALGVYEAYLNGQRVGNDVFNPGWTDYHQRVQYHTYDVKPLLKRGSNVLGLLLGDGWYAGYVGLGGRNRYGPMPLALAQLELTYADGTADTILTDASWKAATGPLRQSDMLMGETYDARLELPGWNEPDYNDADWQPVVVKQPATRLVAACDAPVRKTQELHAVNLWESGFGRFVFDLGQNLVGWVRLKVKGEAGARVTLRFAEMLNPDGTVYTVNLRSARCTDHYILKGRGTEVYEPHFTFHGFRYVEVIGYPGKPTLDALTGVVIHSDTPPSGRFECSAPLINQLQRNIVWGQRGNFLSIPTDCPQRDERLGWMGDAQVFIRTATFNMDVARFFTKWLVDAEDAQRPDGAFTDVSPCVAAGAGTAAWGDAGVICPWVIYQVYGDQRILERHYAAGARWIEYLKAHSQDLLRPAEGYGDWLSIKADTPKDLLATAYFAHSTHLMAKIAEVLHKADDARKYGELFEQIKAAFNCAYVSENGQIKGETQTGYVLALAFELLPPEKRAAAAKRLAYDIAAKEMHLSTGFVGVGHLLPTLSEAGYPELAYNLLNQDTFPSWLYSVKQGATTIWERWDGWTKENGFQDPSMNSFNHYSFGSVGEWMYATVGGIGLDPNKPAFKHIIIRPRPGGELTSAEAEYDSVRGRISSQWRIVMGQFRLSVTIPPNTTATVYVPTLRPEGISESRRPALKAKDLEYLGQEGGSSVFRVGSGSYRFISPLQ
jgi:alpha-L-rhamnosidase